MGYLATTVQVSHAGWAGRHGLITGTDVGIATLPSDLAALLDEQTGHSTRKSPFSAAWVTDQQGDLKINRGTFVHDIETEVGTYHIPAAVGLPMNGLPSQADGPTNQHWVSIVGYDSTYFYYYETCVGETKCGHTGENATVDAPYAGPDRYLTINRKDPYTGRKFDGSYDSLGYYSLAYRNDPRYRYTWRISISDLWAAMSKSAETSYIKDGG
jgi:hypothetical protein